jgi:hypothetical protein
MGISPELNRIHCAITLPDLYLMLGVYESVIFDDKAVNLTQWSVLVDMFVVVSYLPMKIQYFP